MTHLLRCPRRLARLAVALALAGGIAMALCSVPAAQAAQPANACTICPPPSPSIGVTSDGRGRLTVTGHGFTPGGRVQIVANMPPDSMGGGGRTTVTVTASNYLTILVPAGAINTTFPLTFGCGAGVESVTVHAYDERTATQSNAVSIYPWGALPC